MTRSNFLQNVTDWDNHRVLLWLALEETRHLKEPVIEMGCGDGSTRQLHEYCSDASRVLYSFDTDPDWIARFKDCDTDTHHFCRIVNNWEIAQKLVPNPSVILIDHAPGERRIVDIKNYSDHMAPGGIIVIHDTQPPPTAADYGFERIWSLFKYRIDLTVTPNMEVTPWQHKTWASAVSNDFDVAQWAGMDTGNPDYRLTVYPR